MSDFTPQTLIQGTLANSPNIGAIPTVTQSDGSIDQNQGFGNAYTQTLNVNIKDQGSFNQALWQNIYMLLRQNFETFNPLIQKKIGQLVVYNDITYISLISNNNSTPGQNAQGNWNANWLIFDGAKLADIKFTATNTLQQGWLFCDGSWQSKAQYQALWNLIGDTFLQGQVAQSNYFRLPDLIHNSPSGRNGMVNVAVQGAPATPAHVNWNTLNDTALGNLFGEANHILTAAEQAEMEIHTQGGNINVTYGNLGVAGGGTTALSQAVNPGYDRLQAQGGGQGHNTIGTRIALNAIIKTY